MSSSDVVVVAPKDEDEKFVKRDGLMVFFIFNAALLFAVMLSAYQDVTAMRYFTYKWVNRLTGMEPDYNVTAASDFINRSYWNNTNSSAAKLGEMLDKEYELARCMPSLYGGDLQWEPSEVSPTCNCLRNLQAEYAKAVRPNGTRMAAWEFEQDGSTRGIRVDFSSNASRCFYAVRHTQVEDVAWRQDYATNTVSVALFWNSVGLIVSTFVLFFDGIARMHTKSSGKSDEDGKQLLLQAPPRAVRYVTIMGCHRFSKSFEGFLVALALAFTAASFGAIGSFGDGISLVWSSLSIVVLMLACLYYFLQERKTVMRTGGSYWTMRAVMLWIAFCAAAPSIGNAMNMLVQRRDWMLNEATFFCCIATGLCAISVEFLQQYFEDAMCVGGDASFYSNYVVLNRRKNTLIKVTLLAVGIVAVLLTSASNPVLLASSFSNMSCTVLVVSALLLMCLVSLFRHLVHPRWEYLEGRWKAFFDSSSKWDLYPLDPLTLETIARFIFSLAALCDIWMVNQGQWDTRVQWLDPRALRTS